MEQTKSVLDGKHILLGISASIAAYKSIFLVRLLVRKGAIVQVILSKEAKSFVSPLTLATLSGRAVLSDYSDKKTGLWHNHVELGSKADIMLIAPASANTLAKAATGLCDNLLLATYLSARCPVWFAPAMDLEMYAHDAVRQNMEILAQRKNTKVIEAQTGYLASGLHGQGRMMEPEDIVDLLEKYFQSPTLANHKGLALVTAGPTHEAIDPVRFIGNHSSGKMGFALAEALAAKNYQVILVSGPVSLQTQHPNITRIDITTASQMLEACLEYKHADIKIFAAAVADYRPAKPESQKIKKQQADYTLALEKTPDIALTMKSYKTNLEQAPCLHLGFALETENQLSFGYQKLAAKGFDALVLNCLTTPGAGFGHDTNEVWLLEPDNQKIHFPLQSKIELASKLAEFVDNQLTKKRMGGF